MRCRLIVVLLFTLRPAALPAQERPNIVLMDADNLGLGEVGVYGSVRGVPTPRIARRRARRCSPAATASARERSLTVRR